MNLLYKATRDGFSGLNFNEKCNGKKNTFVVVKNEHDKVFGGFTPLEWKKPTKGNHEYLIDNSKKSFLYK